MTMGPGAERKIILVSRETRLDRLVERFNTLAQVKFYLEHLGANFSDYQQEHETYQTRLTLAGKLLSASGRVQTLHRKFLPNFIFGEDDIVVCLGQDGLVANTLKYLDGQALLAVNPDPQRWDGVLLPFRVKELSTVIAEFTRGDREIKEVSMAEARLSDGQVIRAVNDLFIGQQSHVSARYRLRLGKREEQQSSSGIIVSTGLGATGWLKSVLAGASGVLRGLTGKKMELDLETRPCWDSRELVFSVREPFPTRNTGTSLVFGKIRDGEKLEIRSQMAGAGVIFSDGMETDFLGFNSGILAEVDLSKTRGRLVV